MQLSIDVQLNRPNFALDMRCELSQMVTAIIGESGAGKSTLLHMIAGITRPDQGRIVLNQRCLFDRDRGIDIAIHQRHLGIVFQDSKLFPHLSVAKNLAYGRPKHAQLALAEVATLLEIDTLLDQRPHALSGGEKQRVALGRAILSEPDLFMLDEPLASLDQRLKQKILPFLRQITSITNKPMLYISHDPDEIAQITDNVIQIVNGTINH